MTEWDALLETAVNRGYLWQVIRPEVLAGVCHHPASADVIVLSGKDIAHAYRLPTGADIDVFAPSHVYWWYAASPVWTLRALLTLPAPGDPDAPRALITARRNA